MVMILAISPKFIAQEKEGSMDRPESEKTPEERELDQGTIKFLSGERMMLPSDELWREARRRALSLDENRPPATFVNFGKPVVFSSSRQIEFRSNYWNVPLVVNNLSAHQTKECFNTADLFVLSGYKIGRAHV